LKSTKRQLCMDAIISIGFGGKFHAHQGFASK
jgi:hypothetical protein